MMNKEKTLFIFEGVKTESKLIEKLEHNFLGKTNSIKCVFDAEIYQLYRAIKEEKDIHSTLDVVELAPNRLLVEDTDAGKSLSKKITDLKALVDAYLKGKIKTH